MFKSLIRFTAMAAGAVALMVTVPGQAQALDNWLNFDDSPSRNSGSFSGGEFFSGGGGGGGRHSVSIPTKYGPGQIIVSFGDRRLYYVESKGRAISYPIAVPKPSARWAGVERVSAKRVNPSWTPTASMRRENPKLPASVPGGHPRNPLGVRALYLGNTLYRIHGTDAPWLIGREVSKGCVRMHNADVIDLYNRTRIGARVTITWSRIASL
ncbi:MAG: L,D-transpeptidase [Rhodomicrobiaceae bacterium]